jgi:GT2 family glycosyltransferase
MITIIYSTHKDKNYNDKFKNHILNTVGIKDVQILEFINHNQYSLAQVYNSGITESIYDIVVCCHNDIKLEKNWGKKLLEDFSNNPEFGVIGKAGSCYFPSSGVYWEKLHQTMVGQVYHHPEGQKKWINRYSVKLPYLIPVVTIDGLFISFDKTKIKHYFDETIGKFHFYDHGFCVPNYLDGVKLGITSSFEITHESIGKPNDEFWESKDKFVQKWGSKLPLDLKPNSVYAPKIKTKEFKKFKKVAIIIPTKGKVDMLLECIKSFEDHCDTKKFTIFIADTGSTKDEIDRIKDKILSTNNIKLIEYDYYNFAKINNDVVKNHVGDDYEFILFSNNDIKILNDVITGMLSVFEKNKNAGTVGARLHFEDNTIQHNGVFISKNTKRGDIIGVSHLNLTNYYNYYSGVKEIFGNTGGLLMIRKNLFESLGCFNENYISCFEDVELNIMCLSKGLKNYNNSDCVAYHYESQTRNEDPENLKKLSLDYHNNLIKCVDSNIDKIKKYLNII